MSATVADFTKREMRAQSLRHRFLPADVCQGPKWAMMVYLANSFASKQVYTGALALAADAAHTTALRYIDRLEHAGLAERIADEIDTRRTLVRLTEQGFAAMSDYAERLAA